MAFPTLFSFGERFLRLRDLPEPSGGPARRAPRTAPAAALVFWQRAAAVGSNPLIPGTSCSTLFFGGLPAAEQRQFPQGTGRSPHVIFRNGSCFAQLPDLAAVVPANRRATFRRDSHRAGLPIPSLPTRAGRRSG